MVLQALHKHALLIALLKDSKGQYHLAKDSFRGQIKAKNCSNVWVGNIDFFFVGGRRKKQLNYSSCYNDD